MNMDYWDEDSIIFLPVSLISLSQCYRAVSQCVCVCGCVCTLGKGILKKVYVHSTETLFAYVKLVFITLLKL